jgi:hypothetical protein
MDGLMGGQWKIAAEIRSGDVRHHIFLSLRSSRETGYVAGAVTISALRAQVGLKVFGLKARREDARARLGRNGGG